MRMYRAPPFLVCAYSRVEHHRELARAEIVLRAMQPHRRCLFDCCRC